MSRDQSAAESGKAVLSFSSVSPELLSKGVWLGQINSNKLPVRGM